MPFTKITSRVRVLNLDSCIDSRVNPLSIFSSFSQCQVLTLMLSPGRGWQARSGRRKTAHRISQELTECWNASEIHSVHTLVLAVSFLCWKLETEASMMKELLSE